MLSLQFAGGGDGVRGAPELDFIEDSESDEWQAAERCDSLMRHAWETSAVFGACYPRQVRKNTFSATVPAWRKGRRISILDDGQFYSRHSDSKVLSSSCAM